VKLTSPAQAARTRRYPVCDWAGSSRRLVYRYRDEKKVRGRVFGRVCLADGSIATVCARYKSVVHAVAAAYHEIDLYGAHDDLDFGHNSYLSYLAFAHSRRPWVVPDGTKMLGYLSVAVTAAILALRRITGSVALQCMTDQVE
jgi:hypothetical protein